LLNRVDFLKMIPSQCDIYIFLCLKISTEIVQAKPSNLSTFDLKQIFKSFRLSIIKIEIIM